VSRADGSGGALWFIRAAGRIWGPYPEARMADFVQEGRLAAETPVASTAEGPFVAASHQARLYRLFASPEADAGPSASGPPEASSSRALLVWASLKSRRPDRLEALIGALGPYVQVEPGLWLVRTSMTPAALRNALTRRLEAEDRLMVLAAPLGQVAWFNLEGETDRTLRQLWTDVE